MHINDLRMVATCSLLLLFLVCTASHADERGVNILLFGDSITQGFARDASGNVSGILTPPRGERITSWGYGMYLEQLIRDRIHADTFVYNWGYGGLRSDQALICGREWDCLDDVLASAEAQMIMILLGANDLFAGISHTATSYNLSVMLDKSLAAEVMPVIGNITPNTRIPGFNDRIRQEYNPLIRALAREKIVFFADHHAAMSEQWTQFYESGDGLHLSDRGNQRLAESWFDAFGATPAGIYGLIEPSEVLDAGALWRREGEIAWLNSGTIDPNLPDTPQVVEFSHVPGWLKPADRNVTPLAGFITVVRGVYRNIEELSDLDKADVLFDWVEAMLPEVFSTISATFEFEGIFYREYPTGDYLATFQGGFFFVDGDGTVSTLGEVDYWLMQAQSWSGNNDPAIPGK